MDERKQCCVVAKLRDGRYWVGTTCSHDRYSKDLASRKSAPVYVRKHGFVEVVDRIEDKTCEEVVLELMRVHGTRNVRGTTFPSPALSAERKRRVKEGVYPDLQSSSCEKTLYALLMQDGTYFVCRELVSEVVSRSKSIYLSKRAKTLFDEDALVERLMFTFGVDMVRGGSYSDTVLSDAQREVLEKKFAYTQTLNKK